MSILKFIRVSIGVVGLVIIIIGVVSYYFSFKFYTNRSIDETLTDQMIGVQMHIERFDTLTLIENPAIQPARIEKREIDRFEEVPEKYFKDTLMYEERTGTFGAYRQLYFPVSYNNKDYIVTINQPTLASGDLSSAAVTSICIFIVLLVIFMSYISSLIKKTIWKPLSKNAAALHTYDLKENSEINLVKSGFNEFDQIFESLSKMVDKINKDYANTRCFIEDVSHEMQTPLSIMISKLDLFTVTGIYDSEEVKIKAVNTLRRAVLRMSKLNKSLLLISKINNDQFPAKELIDISKILEVYMLDCEELLEISKLKVAMNLSESKVLLSSQIGTILISNLISNAIRHNIEEGNIDISIENRMLTIRNSCRPLILNKEDDLFSRMSIKSQSKESSGLGLNIVKSICDKYNFSVSYSVIGQTQFEIKINFNHPYYFLNF